MTESTHWVASGPNWQADFDQCCATHPLQQRTIHGHTWEYIACGSGEATVLVLPGGLAVAQTAFRYINRFKSHRRVLAPTYPASIMTMADLVEGLCGLVRAEKIQRVHLIGGSYSGLVAQCLVRHLPQMIQTLVLSDTGVPRPQRARQFARFQPLLKCLPLRLLYSIVYSSTAIFVLRLPHNRAFWWRYFKQRIATLTRAVCISHLAVWLDFDRHYQFTASDLAQWRGQILIIEAEHDGLFRPPEQHALRRLYPGATVHTFAASLHGASLARMDEYIDVIAQFLSAHDEEDDHAAN